ncbi:MAG: formyl-CoA transferase [Candidatus Rokubacteria bacterium RBG_16_73_20]|nr:MAG: formyl-CoA transferase [Candidatus Rokubacteria bacterium RBG_16_73_20]HBH02176.1 formyl-CoA transferase [Candidatus Rokubacteria bacterium]
MPPGALDGLRVLDLSSQLSGPYCTMLLGDLGADVVKVEQPGGGDPARQMGPHVGGESAPFMTFNRNKRSLTLDLKAADGRAIGRALAARADVVVESWRPGAAARLGLGWEDVRALNPAVVYASISGFGQTGPYASRGGFDRIAQGMSGLMSINGEEDGPPLVVPVPIADIGTGMFAAIGVLAALAHRARTGRGQRVDASLLETPIAWSVYEAAAFFATGERPRRLGQGHRTNAPYQAFRTADGWLNLGGGSPQFWPPICEVLGVAHLVDDPRFATPALRVANRRALEDALQPRFLGATTAAWLERLERAGVPAGPILTYDQVFADPHVRARAMAVEVDHPRAGPTRVLGVPLKLSETPGRIRRPAPTLGQHTDEVLRELGYDGAAVADLRARRVV